MQSPKNNDMTTQQPFRYTHLVPEEKELARLFIEQNPIKATTWIFDEHLGDGMDPDPTWPAWLQSMSKSLTQRRVDLIGLSPTGAHLIELKQRGNIHAIGQLLVYQSLYQKKYPTTTAVSMALVCRYMGFDLHLALVKFDIALYLV
jgi:hypothetical protein